VLNSKIALFFIAFLPQFVSVGSQRPVTQTLLLGAIFCLSGTIVNGTLALVVSSTSSGLRLGGRARRWLRQICGVALIGLGMRLALSGQR